MSRQRLVRVAWALLFAACSKAPLGGTPSFDASVACEDRDHDGYGRDCERGYDCNDDEPRITTECRTCSRPERGCACAPSDGPISCFLEDKGLEGGDVLCSEGTRHCRDGVWSGCEDVHQYVASPAPDTQRVIDPSAGKLSCSICDVKCFQIVDNLLADGGVAGGNVTFGPGGGITLLPGSGGSAGSGADAGPSGLTGCAAMMACCSTLSDALKTSCEATAMGGDNTVCERDRFAYCPSGTVTGPVPGCTLGTGADTDCDGIPNVVDSFPGKPIVTTSNQAIFHQLDIGETGQNTLDISFKLRNADVYFLLDMTNTMKEERDNLIASLTTGNVINCAHLNQCCNRQPTAAAKASCQAALANYANREGKADDQVGCLAEQVNWCPGGNQVDCPDGDGNGVPDNFLKTQGVVGATRCLVGSSWFGSGFAREAPVQNDPVGCSGNNCGGKTYADRDEQLFKNVIDMTPDYNKVLTALQSMQTDGNWDDPEGGLMALHSVITGKGHYFGINRPSIPPRVAATQCPPNTFGYPCFRKDAVPIVVFFTDRPHHNGPDDPTHCANEGAGCPYNALSGSGNTSVWSTGPAESASDKQARFVPLTAETFSTAYNAGDVRGQYLTMVGDTRFMAADYPTAVIGCNAAADAPDALIRFRVSAPPGVLGTIAPIPINFHLTKDDVYAADNYGTWRDDRTNDPTPATEFGAVLSVFRGVPNSVSSSNDLGDRQAFAIASGPDSTYLTYTGTTMGSNSRPGFLGGVSTCAADGLTNQVLFTFRPTSNARIVVDASSSSFPAVVSLHSGLPASLPNNPSTSDGTSQGIPNVNDTFATANAVPSGSTAIDGAYVERTGDTNVASIKSDYSALIPRLIHGRRVANSDTLVEVAATTGIEPGMELKMSSGWSPTPVRVVSVGKDTIKLSGRWDGLPNMSDPSMPLSDPAPIPIEFLDTLVGCAVDGAGKDAVFSFNVATPRRVRIDTEGSTFDTVISLHDAPPPSIVSKADVGSNGTAPGYNIGDVTNASYTLDDMGMGTNALNNTYDYAQCGAGASSKDAVFKFTLSKPTHVAMDVSSNSWNPIVGLFSSPPGGTTGLDNSANNNDNLIAPRTAFDLGDIYGAVDTKVTKSDLSGMGYDWESTVLGCGAANPGRDQIFKFRPLEATRARITVTPNASAWKPLVAVFDDPPPSNVAITTSTAFDAAAVTLPETNCLAYSFHDPASAAPAHTYAVCPNKWYANDANTRCTGAGMNYLASINSAEEQAFLMRTSIPSYVGTNFHIGGVDPDGDGIFTWRDGSAFTYTSWFSGEPNGMSINNKCADLTVLGQWIDGKCSSAGAAASDSAYYVCEDETPAVLPNEDAVSAYVISPGTTQVVTGSTRRMSSDYNGAVLLGSCGGTIGGGDAVFSITTGSGTSYQLGVDSAGSSYSVVLGLFEGTIDAAGYRTCDAPAGSALSYPLLPSRTYYVVVKGTATSLEGSYKLKFSNLSATTSNGTNLACGAATTPGATASVDVDVDANRTYYVVVDHVDAAYGKYDLEVHSLYRSRTEVANAAAANETGGTAFSLPDPYRSRITVVDTSTAGMTADYGNDTTMGGMCSSSPSAPDAVYKFTPSLTTNLTFTAKPKGSGLNNIAIGVYDGQPGTSDVTRDLNVTGNLNEAGPSAQTVTLTGPAQLYQGNTSAMASNVDATLLECGAYPGGHDAVFNFHLAKQTEVEIDASSSTVTDPVINLFKSGPLAKPTQEILENDSKQSADAKPAPTPNVSSSWLYYLADLSRLSAETQTAVSIAAVNDDAPPGTLQPQDLGDVAGKRVVVSGGDTGPMVADYPAMTCAGSDGAPDAVYALYSETGGTVHVKATPQAGFDTVVGLFDGSKGPLLRLSEVGSLTEDNACTPPTGPKNLTNTTLKTINALVAAAPDINLNCGDTTVVTNDPDGAAGPQTVSFTNWCGTQPTILQQAQANGPELVIFLTKSLQIGLGSTLRLVGSRPVLFVVSGTANIIGQLTTSPVTSAGLGVPGAGGDYGCGASSGGNALSSGSNTGGGGGGGFGTAGGLGGFGSSSVVAGGSGGAAISNTSLIPLRGGCGGGDSAAAGGQPAGAVQLSATTSIVLAAGTGTIVADGANGGIGVAGPGGPGGGSGGAILLQAPVITYVASQLSARGGNGGNALGSGGTPTFSGGAGAATNAAAGAPGQDSNTAAGGGGGGGGYGRIVVIGSAPVSLAPCTTATNEAAGSAWPIQLDGSAREYVERGNTSMMTADHGGMCGVPSTSPDAVYAFTLSKQTTVQIDARASGTNTAIGVFNASSLGQSPVPTTLENDDRTAADTRPTPTPDAVNTWLAYRGDLLNLTAMSQPQTSVDNSGNANEIIPTELPDPIDRRITVTGANTSMMSADYLAPTCSMPTADMARDAIYRFVPSKSGPVRVSANYSQTLFNPVVAMYRGAHDVIDERVQLIALNEASLAKLNIDLATIKVYNLARTVLYTSNDYTLLVRDANTPVMIRRTSASAIPNNIEVSIDYIYDSGAPLPSSQQQVTQVNLGTSGNLNENALTAAQVPLRFGQAYVYTGDTTAMSVDVDGALFSCGPPAIGSRDATFDFSVDKTTTVSINTEGSTYDTTIALFSGPYSRPSTTLMRSPAAITRQLYDVRKAPGAPEGSCSPYDYSSSRFWFCSTARPWEQAEGMCRGVGLHLVTIDNSDENAALLAQIQGTNQSHHIGFAETVPYTDSWGAWTSGGGGTTGSLVSNRFVRWATNEPNGTGDCLQMLSDGTWDDTDCSIAKSYICEKNDTVPVAAPGTCSAPLTYGGHLYYACSDKQDWVAAQARCSSANMRLVRVEDQAEDDQLRVLLAGSSAWIGGSDSLVEGSWVWTDSAGFWIVTAYRNWVTGEPNQETTNPGSRMLPDTGQWVDTPATSGSFPYICEDPVLPPPGNEPTPPTVATPQLVDVFSAHRQFTGSTEGVASTVAGWINSPGCVGAAAAPDAVFEVPLTYRTTLSIDITGSFSGSLVGLFKDGIGAQGYTDAGSRCGLGSSAGPQLMATLDPGTYLVVITGAAAGSSGVYNVRFDAQSSDAAAFSMRNDTLTDAHNNPLGSADGKWLVKKSDMAGLTPTIGAVTPLDMGTGTDTNDVNPQPLGSINENQVVVTNASTIDLAANYPGGTCNVSATGPDALYSFTAPDADPIQVRFTPAGWSGQVVVFDGAPLDTTNSPLAPISLAPGYMNETPVSAQSTPIAKAQGYLGNLTMMSNDVSSNAFNQSFNAGSGSPASCNADPAGSDAFFKFNLTGTKTVEISSAGTPIAHTIALWDNKPFTKPIATTLEYDSRTAANMVGARLGSGDDIDDDWVVARGDMSHFTPYNGYSTFTETVDYPHDDTVHSLGNVNGQEVVTVNATTSGLAGDFLASTLGCGGTADGSADAIYSFTHSAGGRVRLSLNNPTPAFAPNLALFRGQPLTAAGMNPTQIAMPNTNEALTSAYVADPIAAAKIYTGSTASMMSNYLGSVFTQGSAYGTRVCNPDGAGKDAFVRFTVPGPGTMEVEISSLNASFDQTIALWDSTPIAAPTAAAMTHETRSAAYSSAIGNIDNDWVVKSATMSTLKPDNLTAASPTVASTDDVQDLLDPVGKRIAVSGNTGTAGLLADFPFATLGCGTSDTPADIIYKVRPTANTTIRAALNNPSNPPFTAAIAVLNGTTGHPQRFVDTTPIAASTPYCSTGFNYSPSNFSLGAVSFASAQNTTLNCSATLTFDSDAPTATAWSGFCGQTQPVPVPVTQSGAPTLLVLPFKSLTIASGTNITLRGSRAVVFAVEGNASLGGIIRADGNGTTAGGGGHYSCGSSTGGDGTQSITQRAGGGGGGFGTKGGKGGESFLLTTGGAGGAVHGTATLVPLIGGCPGGDGSNCSGPGGGGGGAFQISVGQTLTVTGTLSANGAQAPNMVCGFLQSGGGGGGGSGGAILLEGNVVNTSGATITTNGGRGADGSDGNGGAGSSLSTSVGANGQNDNGGGGGGFGRYYPRAAACAPAIESFATAATVPIGLTQTFTGPSGAMMNNLAGTSANWGGCTPDASGPDAFWKFTLTRTTSVEVNAASTNHDHTLAFFNSAMSATACSNGTSGAGASITRSLAAGTYYVGLKSRNGGTGGNFNVAFRDTTAGVLPYSPSMGCSTTAGTGYVDAALTANNDYYIIVKGASAGLSGTYNLVVTDIGAVQAPTCGDPTAPDAYFDFEVNDAAGRTVTISLNETGGRLDGSFQLMRDAGTLNVTSDDTTVGACQASASTYTLAKGRYYVIVRGAGLPGTSNAEITIRDDGGMNALDCMNANSGAAGTITRTLAPGTYYAGITGRTAAAGGAYSLQIRDKSIVPPVGGSPVGCADSNLNLTYDIPVIDGAVPYYAVVKGAAAGAAGAYTLTVTDLSSVQDLCDAGDTLQMDPTAPDAYYAFNVTDADGGGRDVTVSLTATSALDGVYRLFRMDSPSVRTPIGVCHDRSAPFTYTDLAPGNYYVVLRGKNVASGGANATYELSINDQDAYGSLTCRDGIASSGTSITRTLTAGDYFVGIKPQPGATNPKDYRIQFRDTAEPVVSGGTEIGCGTSVVNANVTAGNTYYVLVKGNNGSARGDYGLAVTDLGGSANWNCNDDPGAGDAYFEFNVDDPAGRRITIDTENSALDTVLAIFPLGATIGASGVLACDDNSGATAGSSKITKDLAPGVYYAVVRPRLGAANPSLPFELSVRDESVYSSIACGATSPSGKAQIRTTLEPGTYHTVLKGMSGSAQGAYKIRFRDETPYLNAASEVACNDAQNEFVYNVTAGKPHYVVVKGAATDQSGPYRLTVENMVARNGMGCNANPVSPDAIYRFHLSADTRVQIDTIGSQTGGATPETTDTVIALYDVAASYFGTNYAADRTGTPTSCDDNGADAAKGWSKIVANLAGNRDYYVVVKSKSSGWGGISSLPYVLNVRDLDTNQPIACGSANSSLLLTEQLPAGDYRVVVSNVNGASGGGPFDVRFRNVTAQTSGATQVACSDTPDEFSVNLAPRTPYYLMVKGDSASDDGAYSLVVETAGSGATSMGCGAQPSAPDAFFKFNLASQAVVDIDTNRYVGQAETDTVIALYPGSTNVFGTNYARDVGGAVVPCDDNGGDTPGASRIKAELAAGSYYLVVKGKTLGWNLATQPFSLSIRDLTNTGKIACASSSDGNKRIVQSLPAGDYQVVMGTASASGGAYSLRFRDTALSGAQAGKSMGCDPTGTLTVPDLEGGHEYYLVVKGSGATESGGYTLTMEDTVSLAAASGSTSIACAAEGMTIDNTYPAGTYYALVTGQNGGDGGKYTLKVRDADALLDQNRLACDDNGGANNTSVIERDLKAGTHYVVVKGNGDNARGAYSLHIRDKDSVPDRELACGGADESQRIQADVKAGQDYTVLLKGDATAASGNYNIKLYDQLGLQTGTGQNLKCLADAQPTTLFKSTWHRNPVDFDLNLTPDTYYVAVKGAKTKDKGTFQLQVGEKSARTSATYTPPSWTEIQDALASSAARVLPVIATGGEPTQGNPPVYKNPYITSAEAQAKTIALTSKAVRKDGTPIWQRIQRDGRGTGSGLITGIAEIADYLSMDVSLVAIDGPDPGASKFRVNVSPGNSPSCVHPHPLVDTSTGVCTPRPGNPAGYSCNTQYQCSPGAAPKFTVTFTNPADSPVPPNTNDAYGGYHFRLQIIGDKKYLLDEVPVYIIPTTHATMGPPTSGSGLFEASGVYTQDIDTAACPTLSTGGGMTNDLPQWSDLYFSAGLPEGTSMDMELCTKEKKADLASCMWSAGTATTRKKVTVRSKGTCASNSQCLAVPGYGDGYCASGSCQFISEPKVAYDTTCVDNAPCPNGPLGAGEYVISSRCETTRGAVGYGHCVYTSQPADMGATLLAGEQGQQFARVRFTLHSDATGSQAPTLYQWNLTYYCKSAQ